jgi:hypothetical protein
MLLGAYLKDSQMFHLLSNDPTVQLVDYKTSGHHSVQGIVQQEVGMEARFGSVHVWPLTEDHGKISVSKYQIGVLVPERSAAALAMECLRLDLTPESIRGLQRKVQFAKKVKRCLSEGRPAPVSNLPVRLTEEELRFLGALQDAGGHLELLPWFLSQSFEIYCWLKRCGKLHDAPPLLVINNNHLGQSSPYLLPDGDDTVRPGSRAVFRRISSSSHGLNTYLNSNMIVYLAALNPPSEFYDLMSVLLPGYQPDKDHAAEACVQAVTRTHVRVGSRDGISPVHVVLPDQGLASLIQEKMQGECKIRYPHHVFPGTPQMVTIGPYLNAVYRDRKVLLPEGTAGHLTLNELNRRLLSARALLHKARKHPAVADPGHPKHKLRVEVVERRARELEEAKAAKEAFLRNLKTSQNTEL